MSPSSSERGLRLVSGLLSGATLDGPVCQLAAMTSKTDFPWETDNKVNKNKVPFRPFTLYVLFKNLPFSKFLNSVFEEKNLAPRTVHFN